MGFNPQLQDVQSITCKAVDIYAWGCGDQMVCGAVVLVVLDGLLPLCSSPVVIVWDVRFVCPTSPTALVVRTCLEPELILEELPIVH